MKRRLPHWGILGLVLVALVIMATTFFTRWMNGSSNGTVRVGTPVKEEQRISTPPTAPVSVTSAHYTTTLPGGFTVKRQADLNNSGPITSQLSANTNSDTDQQVGITIGTLPSEGLAGVADYHLRTSDTVNYATFSVVNLPAGGIAFRTLQGPTLITVFWPHGTQYAELTFSTEGKASIESLIATYNEVVKNWMWK